MRMRTQMQQIEGACIPRVRKPGQSPEKSEFPQIMPVSFLSQS